MSFNWLDFLKEHSSEELLKMLECLLRKNTIFYRQHYEERFFFIEKTTVL